MKRGREEGEPIRERSGPGIREKRRGQEADLAAWLIENAVWMNHDAVELSRDPDRVVHGLGCVAKSRIPGGTELFRVPRSACFGAQTREEEEGEEEECGDSAQVDTQTKHAILLLRGLEPDAAINRGNDFGPLIRSLPDYRTYTDLVWLKSDWKEIVRGTELEPVVANKVERLLKEYQGLSEEKRAKWSLKDYSRACGVVISHMNPWFGCSIVPFAYILNCPAKGRPNVHFLLDDQGDTVVGSSICDIAAGQELLQSYGNDLANTDTIFRCGFVLPGIQMQDVVSITWEEVYGKANELPEEKCRAVRDACVMQQSPWYGLEDMLTVEIALSEESACGLNDSIAWLRQLAVACFIADCTSEEFKTYQILVESFSPHVAKGILDVEDQRAIAWGCLAQFSTESFQEEAFASAQLVADARKDSWAKMSSGAKSSQNKVEEEEEEDEPLWEVLSKGRSPWKKYKERVIGLLKNRKARLDCNACNDAQVSHLVSQEHTILVQALWHAEDFFK